MDNATEIPPEIRATVEANAFFDAVRSGDYQEAAASQERLREMGWHLSRVAPNRQAKRVKAVRS